MSLAGKLVTRLPIPVTLDLNWWEILSEPARPMDCGAPHLPPAQVSLTNLSWTDNKEVRILFFDLNATIPKNLVSLM